jgi:hypothetical protein
MMKSKSRIPNPLRSMFTMTILFLAFSFGCNPVEQSPIVGAWQLDHVKFIAGDTLYLEAPGTVSVDQIKLWSASHFVFVGQFVGDTSIMDDFGLDTTVMDSYGGGTYTLEGNSYEEHIEFHTDPGSVGNTVKMLVEISNDTLVQTWPVDENGKVDSANYRIERYIRLD